VRHAMSQRTPNVPRLTEADLDFIVEVAAPEATDRALLKRLTLEDESFRKALIGDERVLQRVTSADEELLLRISPSLYFEVLLRNAQKELSTASHTMERAGAQRVPVFDVAQVVDLLDQEPVLYYLTDLLSSFTRIESRVMRVRVRPRVWRRIRFNDMDIDSLIRFAATLDEEQRFAVYKRIADVCLFVTGVFPEYAHFDYRYPGSRATRPQVSWRARRGMEEYEREGRRFYRLAAEHPVARGAELSGVLTLLHDRFGVARKPLDFVSEHYLHYKRSRVFGLGGT